MVLYQHKHRRDMKWNKMQDAQLGNKQFNPDDIRHTAKCPALTNVA